MTVEQQNRYLDFLINPSFQGVNRLFVLSFQNNGGRTSYTRYYLPLVEVKDYNAVINGRNIFDQPVKNNFITYDNIQKIATGQGDHYTTGCVLDYKYFNNYYKIIAMVLKSDYHLPKKIVICLIGSPLTMMKNSFYFILKSLFVQVSVKTFWSCRKNGLIRKLRLTSKFMT